MRKVIKWITPEERDIKTKKIDTFGLISLDYEYREIDNFDDDIEDALIKELIEKKYVICGDTHQYMCLPVFDGNECLELSMRKWGEIMAKAYNLKSKRSYTYKDFYLKVLCPINEELPNEKG